MKISNIIKSGFTSIIANKARSMLTILGIVIGISSVIIMMSVGKSAQNLILSQIKALGSNVIIVFPGSTEKGKPPQMVQMLTVKTLSMRDVSALQKRANVPFAKNIAPIVTGGAKLTYNNQEMTANFIGTTPAIQIINNTYVKYGRFFTENEAKNMSRIVVIGSKVYNELFGNSEAIGKYIKIKKMNFRVIGVMQEKGVRGMEDPDREVYIPLLTAQKQLLGINYLNAIELQAQNSESIDKTIYDVKLTLREQHRITGNNKDDFTIKSQKEFAMTMGTITRSLTIFLSCIAGIALLVGGIGIMNIMLVSVTERTKEIGLRKAVGAKNSDILRQFLAEAIILTGLGGIIGIIFGLVIAIISAKVIQKLIGGQWSFVMPISSIVLAFSVCALIGLVFGIYPAKKASKLDPIEALRYE